MWLFLYADHYMTDKLTIHDACYKFHLNLHRQHHSKDMTKQQSHNSTQRKRVIMCVHTHRAYTCGYK